METLAAEIRRRLGSLPRLTDAPLVSIVVVNRDGVRHLRRLLSGLEARTDYPQLELILVDNDSSDDSLEVVQAIQTSFPASVVANWRNESFSYACNQGAEQAQGELLLFLNNDIEPFEAGWLRELVACLEQPGTGLVGATLLQPNEGADHGFFVQHRAMRFRQENGLLRADLHGRGDDPLGPDLGQDVDSPIAAGACMLIRRDLFRQIGGFTDGFVYGGEDIDLGLKMLDSGERVVYSGRSHLIHRLGSTRVQQDLKQQQAQRQANRRLLWERWGPRLRREYELDRIDGGGLWTNSGEDPTRPPNRKEAMALGFCLRSEEPPRGNEDPLELLQRELESRGHPCLLLCEGEIDDVQGFGYDVAVHLHGPTSYSLGPAQLNVLWAPGSADPIPPPERDRYHLTSAAPTAPELIDAILARAEQLAFPTRIGTNAGPRSPEVRRRVNARKLDFIVIGVQKGGTTSLWQHLRQHPSILMPDSKEEPFFSTDAAKEPDGLESFTRIHFNSPSTQLLGKVTPPYMLGSSRIDVAGIAERIARALPEVRLIALLRDPIDRAYSQWRMSVRQGIEFRPFDVATTAQLESSALTAERLRPSRTGSYVVAGEYGRILAAYRQHFPPERMLIEMSTNLERDPAAMLDQVLKFLDLPTGFRPQGLDVRHNQGGRRLDGLGEAQLFEFLEQEIWPRIGEDEGPARHEFKRFYEEWSAIPQFPGSEPPPISAPVRERLRAHYLADAHRLAGLGIGMPWLDAWQLT